MLRLIFNLTFSVLREDLNSYGKFLCKYNTSKAFGYFLKSYFHAHFKNTVKPISHIFQFQFNSGNLENVQIRSSKNYMNPYACRLTEPNNFWSQNNYFWKVSVSYVIQNHWKKKLALS